MLNNYGTSDLV